MRKTVILASAALAVMALGVTSCGNKCNNGTKVPDKDELYTGVLPAADAEGVRYMLKLDYEDDDNNMSGDYDLVETYLVADSISPRGYEDGPSYKSEGDFTVMEQGGKKYLKLLKDMKDSSPKSVDTPIYFEVASDSTLVLVNSNLQPSVDSTLNYTLKLVNR